MTSAASVGEIFEGPNPEQKVEESMTRRVIVLLTMVSLQILSCADGNRETGPLLGNGRPLKPENFPNIHNSIYGAWAADTAEFGSNMAFFLTLYFNEQDEIGIKRTCVGMGDEVDAAAVVHGTISQSQFAITEAARVTEKGGRISDCTLNVNAGSFSYTLNGDRLEVSFSPGETRSFTRSKE